MNDLGDLAVNPAWASSSVHLPLGRQQEVEERKACYHESIVRRTYLHHDGWIEERGWGKEEESHYYVTLTTCDILRYSAPPSQPCGGLSVATKPPAPLTDDMTTGQRVFKALARLEMARRNPDQRDALFDWAKAGVSKTEYWQKVLDGLQEIDLLLDNADFGLNAVLRLIYLYGALPAHFPTPWLDADRIQSKKDFEGIPADPNFDEEIQKFIIQRLLAFKYWHDDSFRAKKEQKLQDARKAQDKASKPKATDYQYEMQYWSENHQILFATAEYLAGQLLPDNIFRAGEHYRSKSATDYTDVNGREHMQHARSRILNWLNDRLRFGFSEWNAPGYYDEHFHAVLNLADFCLDDAIQSRACLVLDLMIFDLARFTHKGSFAAAAGRAHFKHKNCGWQQSAGDMTELLFGARSGVYVDADNLSAAAFASSRRYQVPEVLLTIGQEQTEQLIDRSRLSINFDEAHEYGIGFEDEADVMRWWTRAAWFSKQVIHGTRTIVEKYDLQESKPYQKILPMTGTSADILSAAKILGYFAAGSLAPALIPLLGNPFKQEDKVANAASVITEGSAYTRGNLYTYRNRDAMLSSVQNYRAGQMSFQGHSCQATLSMCATIFTTHPSAGGGIDQSIMKAIGMIGGGIIGGITGGLLGIVAGPLGFVGEVAGAYYGAKEGGKLLDKDIHFLDPDEDGTDGPGWWTGSVTQPRIVQMNNAAIIAYKPKAIQLLLFGHRFHAWFPKAAFDQNADRLDDEDAGNGAKPSSSFVTPMPQVKTRVSAIPSLVPVRGNANVESGAWIFGRVGDGYIGLYSGQSPQWTDSGDWKDKEVIAEGKRNIFIIQIGNKNEYGSYERFKQAVARARIHINGLHWELSDFECSYDIPRTNQQIKALGPGNDRLELHYDDQVRFRGKQFDDDNFPRFDNPYITCGRVLWGQHYYTIKHPNFPHTLTHDFRALSQDASPADAKVARYIDSHERDCSLIEKLQVRVVTSSDRLSGTDNDVYFDIGPLGWKLDKPDHNDFERGSDDTYDLPLPKDIQLTTRDLVWLRLHKKGILGVDGTGDGLDGAWKPARIQLLVNESPLYEFEINKWLDSDNPMWMQIVYQANVEELFARSLRLLPNAPISSFDEDVAFITTPLFKKHGISGWWDISQLSVACAEGTVVYPPAKSTDSLATIDLDMTRLDVGRARFSFNNPQGIAHKRYLRIEYRFRMQPFPQASGAYSVPLQGQRVRICGDVKWDSDKEGWYEIHPRGPDDITIL